MLLPLALRILRDRAEAEDVVHDAFVAVSDRAGQYVPDRGTVVAWLVTLVRNLSIDRTRRRDRRGSLERDIVAHEPAAVVDSPETLTSDAAERAKIRRALAQLPAAQRDDPRGRFLRGALVPGDRRARERSAGDDQVARRPRPRGASRGPRAGGGRLRARRAARK